MAGKTTRITAVIQAQVTGTDDLADLSKQLGKIPDKTTAEIAAEVTGQKDLDGFSKDLKALPDKVTSQVSATVKGDADVHGLNVDLDSLPGSTSTKVSATVRGDDQVSSLNSDIDALPRETSSEVWAKIMGDNLGMLQSELDALPKTTDTQVSATVTGDSDVDGLRTDLAGLPSNTAVTASATVSGDVDIATLSGDLSGLPTSTATKVDATVSGDDKVDALVAKLANAPKSTAFTVTANIKETGTKGGIKQVGHDIDEVKGKARDLGVEGGAFASQFLSPYSQSIGLFGDLGEQLRNLSTEAKESGKSLKGALTATGVGTAAVIGAGLGLDAVIKDWQAVGKAVDQAKASLSGLLPVLEETGGQWDNTAQKALNASIAQTDSFKALTTAGISWSDAMAIMKGQAPITGQAIAAAAAQGDLFGRGLTAQVSTIAQTTALYGTLGAQAKDYDRAQGLLTDSTTQAGVAADGAAAGYSGLSQAATAAAASNDGLATSGDAAIASADETTAAADAYAQSLVDQASAAADAAQAELDAAKAAAQHALDTDDVSTALDDESKSADAAKRSLDFLQATIDKITGRNRSLEETTATANESLLAISSTADDLKKKGGLGISQSDLKGLKNWNVALLTTDESGQKIYKTFTDSADAINEHTASVYSSEVATKGATQAEKDARKAADESRASFIKKAQALGLTVPEAEKVADKLGILKGIDIPDKAFKAIADDAAAKKKLDELNAKKIDTKKFNITGDKTKAENILKALKDQKVADKVQKILGSSDDAKTKIKQLEALGIPPKYAKIIAEADNVDEAQADIQEVADGEYDAKIKVSVEAKNLAQKNLLGYLFPGVGLQSVLPDEESGAAPAAGLRSVPTGAAVGVSAFSAPLLGTSTVTVSGPPSAFYQITINGAIDKDGTARTLEKILNDRARRIGPTQLGGRRAG